jgi:haloacetate dehalogenase
MVALMAQLGFERFALAGHDRGGRVGYRLALDHPARLTKLAVLDIIPTGEAFRRADRAFGLGYWHWFLAA